MYRIVDVIGSLINFDSISLRIGPMLFIYYCDEACINKCYSRHSFCSMDLAAENMEKIVAGGGGSGFAVMKESSPGLPSGAYLR